MIEFKNYSDEELKQKELELIQMQKELKHELKTRTPDLRNRKRFIFNYSNDTELELLKELKELYINYNNTLFSRGIKQLKNWLVKQPNTEKQNEPPQTSESEFYE